MDKTKIVIAIITGAVTIIVALIQISDSKESKKETVPIFNGTVNTKNLSTGDGAVNVNIEQGNTQNEKNSKDN